MLCVSVNDAVVHGIPNGQVLADGDLVSIDFGAILRGWCGDSARSFVVGTPRPEDASLIEATDKILAAFPEKLQQSALRQLQRMGVDVRLNTAVETVNGREVTFKGGACLDTDTVVWTAGIRGAKLGDTLGVTLGKGSRVPVEPALIRPGEFHHRDGLTEGRFLLSMPDRPTAIFASSDLYALGVYEAARSLGIAIPGDLSVVGIDNHDFAAAMGLTTVGQRPDEQAELATKMLLDELDGQDGAVRSAVAPHELIIRRTTAPPQT